MNARILSLFFFALTQYKQRFSYQKMIQSEQKLFAYYFIHFFPHNQRPGYKGEHNLLI